MGFTRTFDLYPNAHPSHKMPPIKFFLFVLVLLSVFTILGYFKLNLLQPCRIQTSYYDGNTRDILDSTYMSQSEGTALNFSSYFGGKRRHFFPSKDVLVRAVYFDNRPREKHLNTSVFLVLVWKNITADKLITGCQVGGRRAKHFSVNLIGETPYWRAYPQYDVIDHEEVLVHCYDLPAQDGEEAILYYRMNKSSSTEFIVRSEQTLMFPKPRVKPTSVEGLKYDLSILTCTKVYGTPTWLKEWLIYQKTLGVDHVHLTADDTFFRSISNELAAYLEGLIVDGFLSVDFWMGWLNNGKQVWYHNQGLILEDCIYQFRGTYDYVYILDTDDFFTPRVPGETKAHYYIDKMCVRDNVGTCKFKWIEYYPDHFGMNASISIPDGNVTKQLLDFSHLMQGNRKSVHRTNAIVDSATHYAYSVIEGYKRIEFPEQVAYVAHIRRSLRPNKKSLKEGLP